MTIEDQMQQTKNTEPSAESIQQSDEQHQSFYTEKRQVNAVDFLLVYNMKLIELHA